jgi:uncharacterized membrane protein
VIRATTSNPTTVRVALLVVLAAGAFLRLNALGAKTIRQDETYVPNISLPDGASDPAPRKTLVATLTGSMWDVHPPTWYLGMWFWTKVFGTTLYAMRFPSALFGTLAIALTFAIARLESDSTTALIAAALVAFNGLQVLWSQIARQYTWVCCLGLCATWFLLLAIREPTRRTIWLCLYGLSLLGGLLSLYYFWPLFAAHVIWAIITRHEARLRCAIIRLQFLILILASPILAISVFQSKASYLGSARLTFLADYLRFGFLFEQASTFSALYGRGALLLLLTSSALFTTVGLFWLRHGSRTPDEPFRQAQPVALRSAWLAGASALMSAGIVALALVFRRYQPLKTWPVLATALAPILALAVAEWFNRDGWRRLEGIRRTQTWSLVSVLAIIPIAIVGIVSLAIPFLAPKGALLFTPYLFIVIAAGIRAIMQSKAGYVVIAFASVMLVTAHAASIRDAGANTGPQDYAGMASTWRPLLMDGDIVFAKRDWATTGVFFYLDINRYRFVGDHFDAVLERRRPARVWVVSRPNLPGLDEMVRSLNGLVLVRTLQGAAGLRVDLYERQGQDAPK